MNAQKIYWPTDEDRAKYGELVKKLAEGSTPELLDELYNFMSPFLLDIKCKKIGPKKIRSLQLLRIFQAEFRHYLVLLTQHPVAYWKRLATLGGPKEFEEYEELDDCRQALKQAWKSAFANEQKKSDSQTE
jgi:hypothetical protein